VPTGALRDFYEDRYADATLDGRRLGEWRRVSGIGKADRILHVLRALPADGISVLDVGCGDGALLVELSRRRPGWALSGAEIAPAAAEIARSRTPGFDVRTYDGERLPWPDASFDVGVLSHVLEHVDEPVATLREVARVCRRVAVEVPLERNLAAARRSRRTAAARIGHLRRLSRRDVRALVATAGLELREEVTATPSRATLRFFAAGGRSRAAADLRWALRHVLHRWAPALAQRLFTVHYLALCIVPATTSR
jgi:SAM-dependent methyltransferase